MLAYLFHRAKHNLQLRGQSVNKNMSLPPDSAKNPLSTEACLRHPCLVLSHCLESTWTLVNIAHVTKWTDKASEFCKALLGGYEQLRIPGKKKQGFRCFLLKLLLDYLVLRPEGSQMSKFVCVTQVPFKKNLSFLKKKKACKFWFLLVLNYFKYKNPIWVMAKPQKLLGQLLMKDFEEVKNIEENGREMLCKNHIQWCLTKM